MAPTPFVFGPQLRGGGTAGFIKDKPGSQGVLFRGGTELSDERWPRGYTPERQAEVVDALGTDRSGPGVSPAISGKNVEVDLPPQGREGSSMAYWQADRGLTEWSAGIELPGYESNEHNQPGTPRTIAKIRRKQAVGHKIVEAIARSDTPVEELQRRAVPRAVAGADGRVRADSDLYGEDVVQPPRFSVDADKVREHGAHGIYDLRRGGDGAQTAVGPIPWDEFQRQARDPKTYVPHIVLSENVSEESIIHELGHHRSGFAGNRTSSLIGMQSGKANYGTPAATGKEEAFADMNVVERHRADPRGEPFSPKQFRNYPNPFGEFTAKGRTFRKNYNAVRYGTGSVVTSPLPPDGYTPLSHDIGGRGRSFNGPQREHRPEGRDDRTARVGQPFPDHPRLFIRNADASETRGVEDHGQFPLLGYDNEPLGTTTMGAGVPEEFRRGS